MRRLVVIVGTALLLTPASALAQDASTQKEPVPPVEDPVGVVSVTDVALAVGGRSVDAAPPGEPVVATLSVVNDGTKPITNVRISVSAAEDEARLTRAVAIVGDLDPSETGRGAIELVVRPERCNDFIGLAGEATFDGGSAPIKVGIPVACPGPRLWLENVEFEGGDGDGVPEPGETLRMFVTVRNEGRDAASEVKARVSVRGDGVSATDIDLAWRDVPAGRTQRSSLPVLLTVSNGAPPQERCEDLPVGRPAPDRDGSVATLPPDSSVSSDGATTPPSPGGWGSDGVPATGGSGAPGSAEPDVMVDPAPRTETIEPLPAPAPSDDGREPAPEPEPAGDLPVRMDVHLAVSAVGYSTALEYSTAIACALREGGAGNAAGRRALAADDASANGGDAAAVPVFVALAVSAAAVGTRAILLR